MGHAIHLPGASARQLMLTFPYPDHQCATCFASVSSHSSVVPSRYLAGMPTSAAGLHRRYWFQLVLGGSQRSPESFHQVAVVLVFSVGCVSPRV
jgi:hypothetical protein